MHSVDCGRGGQCGRDANAGARVAVRKDFDPGDGDFGRSLETESGHHFGKLCLNKRLLLYRRESVEFAADSFVCVFCPVCFVI